MRIAESREGGSRTALQLTEGVTTWSLVGQVSRQDGIFYSQRSGFAATECVAIGQLGASLPARSMKMPRGQASLDAATSGVNAEQNAVPQTDVATTIFER